MMAGISAFVGEVVHTLSYLSSLIAQGIVHGVIGLFKWGFESYGSSVGGQKIMIGAVLGFVIFLTFIGLVYLAKYFTIWSVILLPIVILLLKVIVFMCIAFAIIAVFYVGADSIKMRIKRARNVYDQ